MAVSPGEIDRTTGVSYGINSFQQELLAFMYAIAGIESGGNPKAESGENSGGRGTAKGVFQFLDATWQGIAPKLGIQTRTASAASAEEQWAVAAHLMSTYFRDYGSWDLVATAWFAGPDRAAKLKAGDTSILNYDDLNGFTVRQYINKMNGAQREHLQKGIDPNGALQQAALTGSSRVQGLPNQGAGIAPGTGSIGGGTADSNTAWNEGVSPTGGQIAGVTNPVQATAAGVPGGGVAVAGPGGATIAGAQGEFALADTDKSGSVDDAEVEAYIRRNFPQVAWALDHPELGKILRDAAAGDWDNARIYGQIIKTKWWQNNPESARKMEELRNNDPATWRQLQAQEVEYLRALGADLGWHLSGKELLDLANRSLTEGWDENQARNHLSHNMPIDVEALKQGAVGGQLSTTYNDITQVANQYMVRLSDREIAQWTRDIATGKLTASSFEQYAKQIALAQYPWMEKQINDGIAPATFVAPYQNWIAQELEITPDQVDLASHRYRQFMYDEETQRVRTLPEIQAHIRKTDPMWQHTKTAQDKYSGIGEMLLRTFGKVG